MSIDRDRDELARARLHGPDVRTLDALESALERVAAAERDFMQVHKSCIAAREIVERLEREGFKSGDAQDAARWRWWQKWWCNGKDDMETINDLDYDGDDPASMNAAVDAAIASEAPKPNCSACDGDGEVLTFTGNAPCPECRK